MLEHTHETTHKIQYYETDQMGIVHHSNYVRWFEEARTDWMDAIGFSYARMESEGVIVPVLAVDCQYKTMAKYGESVLIACTISAYSGVRLSFDYQVTNQKTGQLHATGHSDHAFLNQDYRPISLKRSHPAIHQLIEDNKIQEDDEKVK